MPNLVQLEKDFHDTMQEVSSSNTRAVTVGVKAEVTGWELESHRHQKTQLMLSITGVALCEAEGALWLVPPQTAIIVPAGVDHRIAVQGEIEGYAVFILPAAADTPPLRTATITVNPLLRELIIRSAQFPVHYPSEGMEAKVTELLVAEIASAPTGGLHLPMPPDSRLRVMLQDMMADPSNRGTIESWSRRAGMSKRTLARAIAAETGLSFGRWRERLNIMLALQWMAEGLTVEQAAFDLGYKNAESFVRMFQKAMGMSPARYVAEHSAQ